MIQPDAGDRSPLLDEQLAAGLRGDFKRGKEIADELEKTFPGSHRAAFNRAWYKMMQGHLLEGLECLDRGRWLSVFGDPPLPTSKTIWHGEDLRGKHLLLTTEGGLGDEIINVRFARNFAEQGARVTVTADPSLLSVFSRIEGVSSVVAHRSAPDVYHDFWVPGMSAARVLNTEYSDLHGDAYLKADPTYVEKWAGILRDRYGSSPPKIGLRFWGNPKFEHEQHRKFPPELLTNAVGDRSWVNLQKEETDLPLHSWEDTLALLSHLDLVITSCTSVAHAAAALGRETWIIVPVLPYYIWALPGDRSPWYNTVRLFRQSRWGEWGDVFEKVRTELEKR